jgi:hypothetical protein
MYTYNDALRRLSGSLMESEMRKVEGQLEHKFKDEPDAREHVEFAIEFALKNFFSRAGIGRAAEKLDGDRSLAVTVMLAAFVGEFVAQSGERACEQCRRALVATILPYEAHPPRVICSECGLMSVTEEAGG